MTTFTDLTENAFTIAAPQGWTVKGGIRRFSPTQAKPWIIAVSPDGATTINIGDPSIPLYTLPSPGQAPGSTVRAASGASPIAAYETGVQFAADYARRTFGQSCAPLTASGSQAEPALAQRAQTQSAQIAASIGAPVPPIADFDGGSARFSCGAAGTAGVIDVIDLLKTPGGGFWNVATLISYRAPAARQVQTDQIARAMLRSFQPNAQWQARMAAAAKQQLATRPPPVSLSGDPNFEPPQPGSLKTCVQHDAAFHCTRWVY
jgi:hypothetical protein